MTRIVFRIFIVALTLSSSACSWNYTSQSGTLIQGDSRLVEQARPVEQAQALEVVNEAMIGLDLTVRVGADAALSVSADGNLLPMIRTEMHGTTLKIWVDGNVRSRQRIKVVYSARQLERLVARGSGTVTVSALNGDALELVNFGSMDISLSGKLNRLKVDNSGSGTVDASAVSSAHTTVRMNGAGKVDCGRLAGGTLNVAVNGSGNFIAAGSVRELDATVNGSGRIDVARLASEVAALSSNGAGSITAAVTRTVRPQTTGAGSIRIQGAPSVERSSGSRISYVP